MSLFQNGPSVRPMRFTVEADVEVGLLSRLLAPFARRSIEPDWVQARRYGGKLHVQFAVDAMPAEMIALVEGNLRQVVSVVRVTVETYTLRSMLPKIVDAA
jgi:hypothetical protein